MPETFTESSAADFFSFASPVSNLPFVLSNLQRVNQRKCLYHLQQSFLLSYQSKILSNLFNTLIKKTCGFGSSNKFVT